MIQIRYLDQKPKVPYLPFLDSGSNKGILPYLKFLHQRKSLNLFLSLRVSLGEVINFHFQIIRQNLHFPFSHKKWAKWPYANPWEKNRKVGKYSRICWKWKCFFLSKSSFTYCLKRSKVFMRENISSFKSEKSMEF